MCTCTTIQQYHMHYMHVVVVPCHTEIATQVTNLKRSKSFHYS